MDESYTRHQAIALLAYRDEIIARRYDANLSELERCQSPQLPPLTSPITPNVPDTDRIRASAGNENEVPQAVLRRNEPNSVKCIAAQAQLQRLVRSGLISAFDEAGKVDQAFWLTHELEDPEAQNVRFRRSDLIRILRLSEIGSDAWIPASELFRALESSGITDPVGHVIPLLSSGELSAWLGNDPDGATAWMSIETRLFKLGMTIHLSGSLISFGAPVEECATLTNVPAGPVWFRLEDLQRVGLMQPSQPQWRSVKHPRLIAWLTRFKEQQRRDKHWICAIDLADWYSRRRGAVAAEETEALHGNACQELFRSLLIGDFADVQLRPHLITVAGISRMSPEQAEWFRGQHWAGQRDRNGEPILSTGLLRELMRVVWLPAHGVIDWCSFRNLGLPPWLPVQAPPPDTMVNIGPPTVGRDPSPADQPHQISEATPERPRRRKPAGVNYAAPDEPLVQKMKRLIGEGKARRPWHAALQVVGKAEGYGDPQSKAKRLVGRYSAAFRAERNGED